MPSYTSASYSASEQYQEWNPRKVQGAQPMALSGMCPSAVKCTGPMVLQLSHRINLRCRKCSDNKEVRNSHTTGNWKRTKWMAYRFFRLTATFRFPPIIIFPAAVWLRRLSFSRSRKPCIECDLRIQFVPNMEAKEHVETISASVPALLKLCLTPLLLSLQCDSDGDWGQSGLGANIALHTDPCLFPVFFIGCRCSHVTQYNSGSCLDQSWVGLTAFPMDGGLDGRGFLL